MIVDKGGAEDGDPPALVVDPPAVLEDKVAVGAAVTEAEVELVPDAVLCAVEVDELAVAVDDEEVDVLLAVALEDVEAEVAV